MLSPTTWRTAPRDFRHSLAAAALLSLLFLITLALPDTLGFESLEKYLPLHTAAESFAIVVALMVFALGFSTAAVNQTGNYLLLATAFLAVGLLDLLHMLSFPGMPALITENTTDKTIYFWLAARATAAAALLATAARVWPAAWLTHHHKLLVMIALAWSGFVAALVLLAPNVLPAMFVPETGLTFAKNASESVVVALYVLSALLLWRRRVALAEVNVHWLAAAAWVMALSELYFTQYVRVNDVFNFLGHLYKVAAYAMAGYALFVNTVREPHQRLAGSRAALAESEARLMAIVESAMDVVVVADESQRIVFCSRSAEKMFGLPPEQLLGQPVEQLIPESYRAQHQSWVRQFAESGQSLRSMGRFGRISGRRAGGGEFPAEAAIARITANGRRFFCITLRDLSDRDADRAAIRDRDRRYETLVSNVPGVVYRVKAEAPWEAISLSDNLVTQSGYEKEEFLSGQRTLGELVLPEDRQLIEQTFRALSDNQSAFDISYRIHHRDGSIRWLRNWGRFVKGDDGANYLDGVAFDVTNATQSQSTLETTRERLTRLMGNLQGTVYSCELNMPWRMTFMSQGTLELTGYPAAEFLDRSLNWTDIVLPEDLPSVDQAVQEGIRTRRHFEMEYRIVHRTRGVRWVREKGVAVYDAQGEPQWLDGFIHDVHEKKLAEKFLQRTNIELEQRVLERTAALTTANSQLNEAQRIARLGSWELDLERNHLSWSDEIFRIFEIDPARFGASYEAFLEAIHPDDRELVNREYTLSVNERQPYEILHRLKMPDGRIKHVRERGETSYGPDGTAQRSTGTVQDITTQVLAEAAVHHSHALLDAVFDTTHVMIAVLDAEMNFIRVNRAYARADGRDPGYYVGKNHFALYPNADNESIFRHSLRSGQGYVAQAKPFEYAHSPERGVTHWDWTLTPIFGTSGKVTSLLLTLLNVTERIQALEQLAANEQELAGINESLELRVVQRTAELTHSQAFNEAVLNTVGSLVVVLDHDGRIVRFNQACEQLTGYRADEALGRHVWDFLLPEAQREGVQGVFANLRTGLFPNQYENHWLTRKGEPRLLAWSNTALTNDAGDVRFVIATGIDITDTRLAEENKLAYARAQRDTLVREVHHRIKNNLQGVVGLLRQHAAREPGLRQPVEAAVAQVGAMALVHGLQARNLSEGIALCELTESIVRQVVSLTGTAIVPSVTRQVLRPVPLATDEAVPVALIINELLFNAVKHGRPDTPVHVTIDCEQGWAVIRIRNRAASLPAGLDIAAGRALGTGLSLVRALLPLHGASVSLTRTDDEVLAELRLSPPWVVLPEECLADPN